MNAYFLYIETVNCADYSFDAYETQDYWAFRQNTFTGKRLPFDWRLPKHKLGNAHLPLLDFVHGYFEAPFISERAYHLLKDELEEFAEFRPVGEIREKRYFVLNVTFLADCLDLSRSKIRYSSTDRSTIVGLDQAVFVPAKVPIVPIFKLRQYTGKIFATDRFVNCIRENRITGVGFEDPANIGLTRINRPFPDLPLS